MCDDHPLLAELALRARLEKAPSIDVTRNVLARIRYDQEIALTDRFWAFFAAGSLATAVVVFLFNLPIIRTITDPVYALYQASTTLSP